MRTKIEIIAVCILYYSPGNKAHKRNNRSDYQGKGGTVSTFKITCIVSKSNTIILLYLLISFLGHISLLAIYLFVYLVAGPLYVALAVLELAI